MKPDSEKDMENLDDEKVRALRTYLINILKHHVDGNSTNYKNLLFELRHLFIHSRSPEACSQREKLRVLLTALSGCASEINPQHHSSICEELVNAQFSEYNAEIQQLLLTVYVNMMLQNNTTTWGFLTSMAIAMVPFKTQCITQNPHEQWIPPPQLLEMQNKILDTVEKVAVFRPQIGQQFMIALMSKDPHAMRSCESHCLYLTALFNIMKRPFGANMKERIWEMIIQHLVLIDSNISSEDLVRETDQRDDEMEEDQTVFECDTGQDSKHINGRIAEGSLQKIQLPHLLTTLDAMMELMFLELEKMLQNSQSEQIWEIVMRLLSTSLLTIHQAQFTHFLTFYVFKQTPDCLIEHFVPFALKQIEDEWNASGLRSTYASYIVSLLARAKFAPLSMKVSCFEFLLKTSEKHAKVHKEKKRDAKDKDRRMRFVGFDQQRGYAECIVEHEVFYSCVQGMMYLLCYILPVLYSGDNSIEEIKEKVTAMIQKRVSSLLYHWLKPLIHTAPAVAMHFANLVYQLEIMDCRTLIEEVSVNQTNGRLHSFFPFDPYCLHRSSRFLDLESSYVTWKEVSMRLNKAKEPIDVVDDQGIVITLFCEQGDNADTEMNVMSCEEEGSFHAATPHSHFDYGTSVDSVGA